LTATPGSGAIASVRVVRLGLFVAAVLGPSGCDRPAPPRARVPDKATLYADPGLVPTREGEQARTELAAAAEIRKLLVATTWIDDVHVDVERRDDGTTVLVGGVRSGRAPEDLERRIDGIARGVVGDTPSIVLALGEPPTAAPRRAVDIPLLLAVLGLGASLGLTIDRAWRRRRRTTPRAGTRARR
jgi:hypothetical protein